MIDICKFTGGCNECPSSRWECGLDFRNNRPKKQWIEEEIEERIAVLQKLLDKVKEQ